MERNYETILSMLAKTKRDIEIHSTDFDYVGLVSLANELRRQDRVITLVVGENVTKQIIETLIDTSGDRFNFKFAQP